MSLKTSLNKTNILTILRFRWHHRAVDFVMQYPEYKMRNYFEMQLFSYHAQIQKVYSEGSNFFFTFFSRLGEGGSKYHYKRAIIGRSMGSQGPKVSSQGYTHSDQTVRMRRLICIFAVRTCIQAGSNVAELEVSLTRHYVSREPFSLFHHSVLI